MQLVKNLPANVGDTEMQFWSLGWEDPLEEGIATHSGILAWRIPWTEEGQYTGLQSWTWHEHTCMHLHESVNNEC